MSIEERLENIESTLMILVNRQRVKEYYTVEEFAALVGRECYNRSGMVPPWQDPGRHEAIRAGQIPVMGNPSCRNPEIRKERVAAHPTAQMKALPALSQGIFLVTV